MDAVRTTLAAYTLASQLENLTFFGTGNFSGTGNSHTNTLIGGTGDDTLNGGALADRLYGLGGKDIYVFDNTGDAAFENLNEGIDTVRSSVTIASLGDNIENLTLTGAVAISGTGNSLENVITGNSRANRLSGLDGADVLFGLGGNDLLNGGNGDDFLKGGIGRDSMTGGDGADTFVFTAFVETGKTSVTRDIITDFQTGVDKLDFSLIDANTGKAAVGDQAFIYIGSAAFTAAGQLRLIDGVLYGNIDVNLAADFQIALSGVKALSSGDFVP